MSWPRRPEKRAAGAEKNVTEKRHVGPTSALPIGNHNFASSQPRARKSRESLGDLRLIADENAKR